MTDVTINSVQDVSELLLNVNAQRPYIAEDGNAYITSNEMVDGKLTEVAVAYNAEATLRKDEWELIDSTVMEVKQDGTPFVDYLNRHGLTYNLANALGVMELGYDVVSDMNDAFISMDGAVKGEDDGVQFDTRSMPIPIIQKEWTINLRKLMASRKKGEALDVVQLRIAAKKVSQYIEKLFVAGEYSNDGKTLQGLTKYEFRNTGGTGKKAWSDASITGAEILAQIQEMIRTLKDKGFKNGYTFDLMIPSEFEDVLDRDYSAEYKGSIKTRLSEISRLGEIVTIDELGADEVVLLARSKEVVEAVKGMPMTVTEGTESKGFIRTYNIQEITLPRFKCDYNKACGIVHWTYA